ncbi:phosphatidylserine decarboxylase family protein [Orenia marismortui]|uniref:phosphatidylserine decarboxylase family protein n=1 Tax=Orenia marismortui TaxID=46469 RepID=UPI0003765DB1
MFRMPVAKESIPYIIVLTIFMILFYIFLPILSIIPAFLLVFIIFFFRDPERKVIINDKLLLSPADGRIMEIKEIDEPRFIKGKAKQVNIFLSIFNVHINRSPIDGEIKYRDYRAGKFLPAFKSHASEINEKNYVGIENNKVKVLVNQVTGFIARRIVCWVNQEDTIKQGDRFGLIKFGSCTEIIVPSNVELKVKPGDKVKGGKSIIGEVLNND